MRVRNDWRQIKTIPPLIKELLKWMIVAPLYAAGIAFGLVLIVASPLMIEMLFDPKHASEGVGHLFETLYIWIGVGVMGGGYGLFLAIPPATLTGLAKIVIYRVVKNSKHQERWIYGFAVPVSTLTWFYYLFMYPSDFSFTGSHWGTPAYSLIAMFAGMGLICCWLMLRRRSNVQPALIGPVLKLV